VLANLAVNFWLTPIYGIYAASLADLIGYLVGGILIYVISNRLYPIDWNRTVIAKTFTSYTILTVVTIVITQSEISAGMQTLVKFIIWICYLIYSWYILDQNQRVFLSDIPKKILKKMTTYVHEGN
jgi:O-antigen/teichoic acid export membrane protein